MALACWLCSPVEGRLKKGAVASAHQLSPWCQSLHFLPVCHWCLLSCYPGAGAQREWVSLCGSFKGNCLGLQKFLPLTLSLLVFAARSYRNLSSWLWNPGLGGLVWVWETSLLRYPSRIFIHHMWVWDQPVLRTCPPTSLDGCGIFNSVVVRLHSAWFLMVLSEGGSVF